MQTVLGLLTNGLNLKEAPDEVLAKKRGTTLEELSDRVAVLERIVVGPNRTLRFSLIASRRKMKSPPEV
jgi:hypothetical protein